MIVNLHEYLRQLRQHPGEDVTLDNLEAVLGEQVRRDSLRCYICGRLLPNGYDDPMSHSPRCPRLITMDEKETK